MAAPSTTTAFVTLVDNAYGGASEVIYVDGAGVETQLTQEADADAATLSGAALTVNVGAGATAAAGGTVAALTDVFITYRVTINN